MNSGKLSIVNSDSDELDPFYNELSGGDSPFDNFAEALVIRERIDIGHDRSLYVGQAAIEQVDEVYDKQIHESEGIEQIKTLEKSINTTEFLFIPDSFLAIESSAGEFLIPMLNRNTNHSVFEAEIDLHGYLSDLESPQFWKIGFEQRADGAENGVLHGSQVLDDSKIGELLGKAQKNQIGIEHPLKDDSAKIFATKSGYLELYNPDVEAAEFADYIEDNLLSHLRIK